MLPEVGVAHSINIPARKAALQKALVYPQNKKSKLVTAAVCHEAIGPYISCAAVGSEKNNAVAL